MKLTSQDIIIAILIGAVFAWLTSVPISGWLSPLKGLPYVTMLGAIFSSPLFVLAVVRGEAAFLLACLIGVIVTWLLSGLETAATHIVIVLLPVAFLSYWYGNFLPISRSFSPIRWSGILFTLIPLVYVGAFIDLIWVYAIFDAGKAAGGGFYPWFVEESGEHYQILQAILGKETSPFIEELGSRNIAIFRKFVASLPLEASLVEQATEADLLNMAIYHLYPLYFFGFVSFQMASLCISRWILFAMKKEEAQNLQLLYMVLPGRVWLPALFVLSMFVTIEGSVVAILIAVLHAGLRALLTFHGLSTFHFLLRHYPYREIVLRLFYGLALLAAAINLTFLILLGFALLILGFVEPIFQLKQKGLSADAKRRAAM